MHWVSKANVTCTRSGVHWVCLTLCSSWAKLLRITHCVARVELNEGPDDSCVQGTTILPLEGCGHTRLHSVSFCNPVVASHHGLPRVRTGMDGWYSSSILHVSF